MRVPLSSLKHRSNSCLSTHTLPPRTESKMWGGGGGNGLKLGRECVLKTRRSLQACRKRKRKGICSLSHRFSPRQKLFAVLLCGTLESVPKTHHVGENGSMAYTLGSLKLAMGMKTSPSASSFFPPMSRSRRDTCHRTNAKRFPSVARVCCCC